MKVADRRIRSIDGAASPANLKLTPWKQEKDDDSNIDMPVVEVTIDQ